MDDIIKRLRTPEECEGLATNVAETDPILEHRLERSPDKLELLTERPLN